MGDFDTDPFMEQQRQLLQKEKFLNIRQFNDGFDAGLNHAQKEIDMLKEENVDLKNKLTAALDRLKSR